MTTTVLELFHRTTADAARAIYATGRMTTRENTPHAYFTTDPAGTTTDGYGPAVVAVMVPADVAILDDEFPSGERHYRVPLSAITYRTLRRIVARDRAETDPCEAGTPGCCVDHGRDHGDGCDTW